MTNLLLSLILTTNWTGLVFRGSELGYLATNHILTVIYDNQTNHLILKTNLSFDQVYQVKTNPPPWGNYWVGTNWIQK